MYQNLHADIFLMMSLTTYYLKIVKLYNLFNFNNYNGYVQPTTKMNLKI